MPTLHDFENMGGRLEDPRKVDAVLATLKHPLFLDAASAIKDSGKGKTVLLYKYVEKLTGQFPVKTQAGPDCTSFAMSTAIDCVKAVDIVIKKENELWESETATEDIYAGSRNIIGKGELSGSGGSYGSWISAYVNQIGSLIRQDYGDYDLSIYDYSKAEKWGGPNGRVPESLIKEANKHKIQTTSLIKTYSEAIDAIANGGAIVACSNQGFSNIRDKDGFSLPKGAWAHALAVVGFDDNSKRPGVLICNSWGRNWNSGPKRLGQMDGSFWCDAEVFENRMLRANDSWVINSLNGYPPKKLNLRII